LKSFHLSSACKFLDNTLRINFKALKNKINNKKAAQTHSVEKCPSLDKRLIKIQIKNDEESDLDWEVHV
jgi:hypothetical protein